MKRSIIIFPVLFVLFSFSLGKPKRPVYDLKYLEKKLAYIPAGSFHIGVSDQDVPYQHVQKSRTVSVESFYLFNQEITNGFYNYYMGQVKSTGDTVAYHNILPDTLVWRSKMAYNEPYVDYYLRHPAYEQYPLVGVSYEQCLLFCEWLTNWYNNQTGRKFKKVQFDLPTETQWEWAARGGLDQAVFPWAGRFMRNSKGAWMANFMIADQSGIGRIEVETTNVFGKPEKKEYTIATSYEGNLGQSDNADITAPVDSYYPNGYQLYNMAGNVEEFVKEKGISKGGSWRDTGYYLQVSTREQYDSTQNTSCERGFRILMKVIEP